MANVPTFLSSSPLGSVPHYFCHKCEHSFSETATPDRPVCPSCQSEFVEVIENESSQPSMLEGGGGATFNHAPSQSSVMDTDDPEPERVTFPTRSGRAGGLASFLQGFQPNEPFLTMRIPHTRPLELQIHDHIANEMDQHRERIRQAANSQTPQPSSQTNQQPASQTSQPSSQTSQASSRPSQTSAQTVPQQESETNPPPSQRPRQSHTPRFVPGGAESGAGLADLHFTVGMPWYFMLNHRQHTREQQRQQEAAGQSMMGTPLILGFGGGAMAAMGGMGEVLHSSPGDYAWGPQGLDNMITQMLASLEDPGPPPANQEKIDALPTVISTPENIKNCKSCSVCKEDFASGESLLQLPCSHLYHKDCVLPWLKLHDTCPTCRFHLNTGERDKEKGPV